MTICLVELIFFYESCGGTSDVFFFLRNFERLGMDYLKKVKPMLSDLSTYLAKVRMTSPLITKKVRRLRTVAHITSLV